jgi:hypothetical protein
METVFALLARDSLADATNSIKPQALRMPADRRAGFDRIRVAR